MRVLRLSHPDLIRGLDLRVVRGTGIVRLLPPGFGCETLCDEIRIGPPGNSHSSNDVQHVNSFPSFLGVTTVVKDSVLN